MRKTNDTTMGNTRSEFFETVNVDPWWDNVENRQNTKSGDTPGKVEAEISGFQQKRRQIIAEKRLEMDDLRQQVSNLKKENEEMREMLRKNGLQPSLMVDASSQAETFQVAGVEENRRLQVTVAELQNELQRVSSELASFEDERKEYKTHVAALKDIITVSKQLLLMREDQIKKLAQKVDEIQASLVDREVRVCSHELKEEYERQLQNIKNLRALYEERQRMDKNEKENLKSQLQEAQTASSRQENKNSELQERVDELEKTNSDRYERVANLESQLGITKAEHRDLQAEMAVINQMFSHILLRFNGGQEFDLDQLSKILEENHDLLTDIVVNEESTEVSSALPKVLLELVKQVHQKSQDDDHLEATTSEETSVLQQSSLGTASEIVENLSKVWKILSELLSHQNGPISVLNDGQSDKNPCYKSVQTPTGPAMVLSVSKTFIRLKNLIVEKKSLEKETMRLKHLNTHLESRLQEQEKRLETVSQELSKTWHVVGKMQKQHQQLHTQEKILRYELAQKRKLLNELKEELEYCREKWLQAREKNFTTEEQWKQLRDEFASRKNAIDDLNNSVESGYSDDRESDEDEMDEVRSDDSPEVASNAPEENIDAPGIVGVIKEELVKIENETDSQPENPPTISSAQSGEQRPIVTNGSTGSVHSSATDKTDLVESSSSTKDPADHKRDDIQQMYKTLEEDILQTIKKTQSGELPSTSKQNRTTEEISAARKERLKVLEEATKEPSTSLESNGDEQSPATAEEAEKSLDLEVPASSNQEEASTSTRSPDEIMARREERLQRMEEQAQQLMRQAVKNSWRSVQFSRRLSSLHDRFGESSDSDDNLENTNTQTSPASQDEDVIEEDDQHQNE